MNEQAAVERIAAAVAELGYRSQIDENRVLTSVGGTKTVIAWAEPGSVQFSAGMRAVPEGFGLEEINDYNRRYRFASLYSNPDGSIVLQADFLLDIDDAEHQDHIEKMLSLFEACAGEMRMSLFEVVERSRDEDDGEDERKDTDVEG